MSSVSGVESCLDRVIDIANPAHLVAHVGVPAVVGAIASRFIGSYQPDPNVPARQFSPIAAAAYTGVNALITKLAMDGLCRIGQHVSVRDVFDVVGAGGTLFLMVGVFVGGTAVKHILARDIAQYVSGETVDFANGSKMVFAALLMK